MIIVIDGPAGAGKSSTAKAVAQKLNIEYLDSGALYRALTCIFLQAGKDRKAFFDLLKQASVSFSYTDAIFRVWVNDEEITAKLRNAEVSALVSDIASLDGSRTFVNSLMREAVQEGTYIAEGRDLGTAVFPEADLKFFMSADVDERARRRYEELKGSDDEVSIEQVSQNIAERDQKDTDRANDPLKKAADAIDVDNTSMSFDEQVRHICSIIDDKTELTYTP
jgi:cytidylate kinase